MKVFKIIGFTLLLLLVAFVAVGLFLPDKVHVERSINIFAPQSLVYKEVSGFNSFNLWSPWHAEDPKAKYFYNAIVTGVGAKMSWQGDPKKVGTGSQEIVEANDSDYVKTKLIIGDKDGGYATWHLYPNGKGVKVVWAMDTEFKGNLFARYFGLFFDSMIGKDYEQGLSGLKLLVEKRASNQVQTSLK